VKIDLPADAKQLRRKKLDDGAERWVLLANPDQVKLADVFQLFIFDPLAERDLRLKPTDLIRQGLHYSLTEYFAPGFPYEAAT
jgi:membrane protein